MPRLLLAGIAAAALVATGCGSSAPKPPPILTRAEARTLFETRTAVMAYCFDSGRFDTLDVTDVRANTKLMDKVTAEYGKTLRAMDAYVTVLRRKPDAMPPKDNPLVTDTARHDAENFISDELSDCEDDSTSSETARKWRARLRDVLAGLPPASHG